MNNYTMENDCVGCEVCYNCGKKEDYKLYYCEKCYDTLDEFGYELDEKILCEHCILELTKISLHNND